MATKAEIEELNANLNEAVTEINGKITELTTEIEALKAAQDNGEDIDLTNALGLSRQLKDVVANVPGVETGENQEGQVDGQA